MFEHMKNYGKLLEKISGWLRPEGKLFVHIFTHKWKPYHFEKGRKYNSTLDFRGRPIKNLSTIFVLANFCVIFLLSKS
jgi:cyclopropane fatty-acyl-phospholipid synthase-like methyltransferase